MFYDTFAGIKYPNIQDFKQANAMTSYGDLYDAQYRESIGLVSLVNDIPTYDQMTEKLIDGNVEEQEGVWYQRYAVVPMSQEEKDAFKQSMVPKAVTMRQARLALLSINKLADVAPFINSLPEPIKSKASIEWEYSQEVQRLNGSVSVIGPGIGLTPDQIDDLFILAATL